MTGTTRARRRFRSGLAMAVDLGGTRSRIALVHRTGRILMTHKERTHPEDGPEAALTRTAEGLRRMIERAPGPVMGVGVALASPMEVPAGILRNPPNLPGWDGFNAKSFLEAMVELPVYPDNDANLAALGEQLFGTASGASDLVYITVSTGIGGGIIAGGKLVAGSSGLGGEIGHMVLQADGPQCGCGGHGCLEALASGTAIARVARERLATGAPSLLRDMLNGRIARVRGEHVNVAAVQGDELALGVLRDTSRWLGIGIVNLFHILAPQVVVLGGGVMNGIMLMYPTVLTTVRGRVFPHLRPLVRIVPTSLGDDVGLLGAAARVFGEVR